MSNRRLFFIAVFALLVFFALAIAGQFLGAQLFAKFQKIPKEVITVTTLWDYWTAYSHIKLVKAALIISFIVSFAIPVLPFAAIAYVKLAGPKRELHGSARFANYSEIKEAGLLSDDDGGHPTVIVGKYNGNFLTFPGQQFISLAAPTRSGKGVGIVIPNLLSYPHSTVTLDVKLENWLTTSGFRAKHGQECYFFCPGNPSRKSHRWNPLSYIKRDPISRVGDIQSIANMIYPMTSNANTNFWNGNAQVLFLGLVLFMLDTPEEEVTLANLVYLTTPNSGETLAKWIETVIEERNGINGKCHKLSLECIQSLRNYSGNTDSVQSNILSTVLEPLRIFRNPLVAAATSANDFDLREVRRKRMSIYIGMSPQDLITYSLLVNLFYSQLINENTNVLPEQDPTLKYQCLLLMDEFIALGRIPIIEKAVSYLAGFNLRLLLIYQNKGQLAGRENGYGREGAETISTNCALRIMFMPKELDDAKEYSEILGYQTVKSTSKSKQLTGKTGRSVSESDQRRALMLPQEIQQIGTKKLIISMENCLPIFADKIFYWKDKAFEGRANLPVPEVPVLKINAPRLITRELTPFELENINLDEITNKNEILKAIGDSIGFNFEVFTAGSVF